MTPSEILDDQIQKSKLSPGMYGLLQSYKELRDSLSYISRPFLGADGNHQADINRATKTIAISDQFLKSLVNEK